MTNGNDFIVPIVLGDTLPNGEQNNRLTKHEYFAAMRRNGIEEYSVHYAQHIMGTDVPKDSLENIKWWIEFEEKLAVMRADALIKALNEKP